MSLLGLLVGNGGKTSSTSSSQTDDRKILDNGSQTFQLSGQAKTNGDGLLLDGNNNRNDLSFSTTNFNTVTDLGALKTASDIATESARQGALVAAGALSGGFHFGSDALGLSADAIGANQKALTDALDFGGNAMDYASGAFGSALDANGRTTSNALGFAEGAMNRATTAQGNALDAGLSSLLEALGFGRTAMTNTADAWGNAYASADASRNSAFSLVDSVVGNSVSLLEDQFNKSRTDSASLVDKVLGQVQGATNMLGNAYADSQGRGALTDKMLMVAIGGAVLIAVAAVWRK